MFCNFPAIILKLESFETDLIFAIWFLYALDFWIAFIAWILRGLSLWATYEKIPMAWICGNAYDSGRLFDWPCLSLRPAGDLIFSLQFSPRLYTWIWRWFCISQNVKPTTLDVFKIEHQRIHELAHTTDMGCRGRYFLAAVSVARVIK